MNFSDTIRLIIKRIKELPQFLTQVTGDEWLVLYDPATDITYRVKSSLIKGGEDKTLKWVNNEPYADDEIREWNLKLWQSLQNNNLGNIPTEGVWWTEVSRSASGNFGYYSPGVFTVDPSIVIYNRQMYLINTGVDGVTLPFNSTNFETELAANLWIPASFNPNADQTINGEYNFTKKPTENGIELVNAVELEHGLTSILAQLPVNFRRYLTRNITTLFGTSYYIAQDEKPTGATLDINIPVTATTHETANVIAMFAGPAFTETIEIDTERSNVHIHAFKNNTGRTVYLFAEYYSMATDGSLTFRANSEIQILTADDLKFSLSIALPSFTILPGTRPVIVFKSYQTGAGLGASTTIRVDNDTYSRFEFSVSSVEITQSHPDLTGRDLPEQHPISAITGLQTALNTKQETLVSGINIRNVNGQGLVGGGSVTIDTPHPNTTIQGNTFNGINQLVRTDGSGRVAQSLIENLQIDLKYEIIGWALGDETSDISLGTKLVDLMPFAFTTAVFYFSLTTAPVGSSVIFGIFRNGGSIGTATITAGNKSVATSLVSSFALGDEISININQIGLTTKGVSPKLKIIGSR